LKDCKDKAISVGEKSKLTINIANISKANIGMAAKDSSVIDVEDVTNNSVTTCFSAYNKKQEFQGGFIKVKKIECESFKNKFDIDKLSKVLLNNVSQNN